MQNYVFELTAESDIYMGGADGKQGPAIIRAAGGYACDPNDNSECNREHHCFACEIFGCEGWAKRFSFSIKDKENSEYRYEKVDKGNNFIIDFDYFHPAMPEEYKALVLRSAKILFTYGSVGGKIGQKPGEPGTDNYKEDYHKDYGLFHIVKEPAIHRFTKLAIINYPNNKLFKLDNNNIEERHKTGSKETLPDFNHFFFHLPKDKIDENLLSYQYLNENMFAIVHETEYVCKHVEGASEQNKWLWANKERTKMKTFSKRLFVFNNSRIWGWAKDDKMRDDIIKELAKKFKKKESDFIKGETILNREFGGSK